MDKKHNLTVGLDGTFRPQGKFDTNSNHSDANKLIENINLLDKERLAIYFHGGLVGYKSGVDSAEGMNAAMEGDNTYPLSFVWKSGLMETLRDNMTDIHKTKLFKKLLKFVVKKAGSKLGFDIGARGASRITDDEIEKELLKDLPFANLVPNEGARGAMSLNSINESALEKEMYVELEEDIEKDAEFKMILRNVNLDDGLIDPSKIDQDWEEDGGRKGIISLTKIIWAIVKISIRVIKRFVEHRDHQPYATILEEILREIYIADLGSWVWGGMKKKAGQMWLPNEGLAGKELHVGTYFLNQLNEARKSKPLTIDLVGHSAGSIVICHLMEHFANRYENLKMGKVIFLAPACRADLFHNTFVKHPNRFESFKMFTMTNEAELADGLVNALPKLYPSSLLYLVSGILETNHEGEDKESSYNEPILGMERFIREDFYEDLYPHLTDIKAFLRQGNRLVLTPTTTDVLGERSTAIDHGDFDNNEETKESVKFIINGNLS